MQIPLHSQALDQLHQRLSNGEAAALDELASATIIDQLYFLLAGHARHFLVIWDQQDLNACQCLMLALSKRLLDQPDEAAADEEILLSLIGEIDDHDPELESAVAMRLVMIERGFLEWHELWSVLKKMERASHLLALAATAMLVFQRYEEAREAFQELLPVGHGATRLAQQASTLFQSKTASKKSSPWHDRFLDSDF